MGRVSGKVAIVTGAARGMGAAHARRLVEEGAKVMLTDILDKEGVALARELGDNAKFFRHDVTKEAEWKRIVAETETAFGPVSVLVNNAGILIGLGPTETLDEADFRRTFEVNQVSTFLGMKTVIPSMKRAGGGSIINISSAAGILGVPYALAYTASKFAIRGMTKSAAVELAPFNIRVNSVHPGIIRTPMTAQSSENDAADAAAAAAAAATAAASPAARVGEPEEIANIVLLLASDESRIATGAEFVADGGLSCKMVGS